MDNNNDIDKNFRPTVEWMSKMYDKMNNELFNGELGQCRFAVFTTGRGSQGSVLGWFKITGYRIKISRATRRIFQEDAWGDPEYVNRSNFVNLCRPQIELNGNYSGTEEAFLATLVHEMCHYYTYMNGYAPKQGHGHEFKRIGSIVSYRSKGRFTIQRLASAEQMDNLELSDEMKKKGEKRLENKKSKVTAIFVFKRNGELRLTTTSNNGVIRMIVQTHEDSDVKKVITSRDSNLIEKLFSMGYKRDFRTWRYWIIKDQNKFGDLESYDIETYVNPKYQEKKEPKKIFSINAPQGKFEIVVTSKEELYQALKTVFPYLSDESINKMIDNPKNYRLMENKRKSTKQIIKEVLQEFIENETDDVIDISPDMNLGLQSPLE